MVLVVLEVVLVVLEVVLVVLEVVLVVVLWDELETSDFEAG